VCSFQFCDGLIALQICGCPDIFIGVIRETKSLKVSDQTTSMSLQLAAASYIYIY
jgi:hypothetical protein